MQNYRLFTMVALFVRPIALDSAPVLDFPTDLLYNSPTWVHIQDCLHTQFRTRVFAVIVGPFSTSGLGVSQISFVPGVSLSNL